VLKILTLRDGKQLFPSGINIVKLIRIFVNAMAMNGYYLA
jgi:hypothetical protein